MAVSCVRAKFRAAGRSVVASIMVVAFGPGRPGIINVGRAKFFFFAGGERKMIFSLSLKE